MKIYFRQDFKEILQKPDEWVELGLYRLGGTQGTSLGYDELDLDYSINRDSRRSPSVSFAYSLEYVFIDDINLQVHLHIPESDITAQTSDPGSEGYYTVIYFLFRSRKFPNWEVGFLGLDDETGSYEGLRPLTELTRELNLINIEFNHKCVIPENLTTSDSLILEGIGSEPVKNVWKAKETDFTAIKSVDRYLTERTSPSGRKITELNKFGLKLY